MFARNLLSASKTQGRLASTDIWSGNGTSQVVANNVNLASNGGLVMINRRNYTSGTLSGTWWNKPFLNLGSSSQLLTWWTSNTNAYFSGGVFTLGTFDVTGYTINSADPVANEIGGTYVGHAFKRAKNFYYDMSPQDAWAIGATIDFANEISTLGAVVVAQFNQTSNHAFIWHRSCTSGSAFDISTTTTSPNAQAATSRFSISGTTLTIPTGVWSFGAIIVLVFAHNTDEIVCDEYTGNGSATGPTVTLNWEPQLLLIKRKDGTGNWLLYDNVRDTTNPITTKTIVNTLSGDDTSGEDVDFNSTGFQLKSTSSDINANASAYVYIAVRKQ